MGNFITWYIILTIPSAISINKLLDKMEVPERKQVAFQIGLFIKCLLTMPFWWVLFISELINNKNK